MAKYAAEVVNQAKAWLGLKEADGSYQIILDTYNSQKVLPRGHKMTTKDQWCSAFVTAVAVKLGYTDIIPPECSCTRMMGLLQNRNSWQETGRPAPGALIFYNWEGEKTEADHVGIVEKVENGRVYTIEGNTSDSCRARSYPIGYFEILGYGIPFY